MTCWKTTKEYFTLWFSIVVIIIFLPLPIASPDPVGRCGYCVIVIALYWVTEVIPLAVTSLLPVVLFPLFGVMTVKDVCASYVTNTLMLFIGSLIVAVAVEKWDLHRRLALRTLTLVGPEPKWLLVGVMFPTWFLSMWMSNTAATAMMMPIVVAILGQLKECQEVDQVENAILGKKSSNTPASNTPASNTPAEMQEMEMAETTTKVDSASASQEKSESKEINDDDNDMDGDTATQQMKTQEMGDKKGRPAIDCAALDARFMKQATTFTLAIAYSSSIGGMATLTGTPPNIIFKRFADRIYKDNPAGSPVNFANWMVVGVPLSIVLIIFCWVWLQIFSQGIGFLKTCWRKDETSYEVIRHSLRREYESLGPIRFPEVLITICFVAMALLWVTRKPGFITGWSSLFRDKYVGDSTPAVLIAILLFILPARPPKWMYRFNWKCVSVMEKETSDDKPTYEPILDWNTVHHRMAWGVLLLMGGGFALADGCRVSGLSQWVSGYLQSLSNLPNWIIVLLLSSLTSAATEVTSNAATTTLFVPIFGELAIQLEIHPLYFMIPCTIATSLAFLLPVGTPPNAIVFASGYLRVIDMVKAGLALNIFSVIMLNIALQTWITPLYGLDTLPDEFTKTNVTWSTS